MNDSLLPDALMMSVCGESDRVVFAYTSWLYRISELESGTCRNWPTVSPSIANEMFMNVLAPGRVFGTTL